MDNEKRKEFEEVLSDFIIGGTHGMKPKDRMQMMILFYDLLKKYDEEYHWFNVESGQWEYTANEEFSVALHYVLAKFEGIIKSK